ncbi:unnamed protein product [Mesocestoides corti]|uniref:Protein DGCR14 n=1 Tax=Mesocestoides corti TaxID=53468 RepID=A0A0R3UG91_MESCO|nr:unnamed protein product [Mesocestoides corti]
MRLFSLQHIGKIIQRDFFPDLAELKGEAPAGETIDGSQTPSGPPTQNPPRDPTSVRLDKYLANNTTEDNASFIEIIEESERKREAKLADFFPSRSPPVSHLAIAGNTSSATLAIGDAGQSSDSSETQLSVVSKTTPSGEPVRRGPAPSVESITSHNAVHFIPDGAPLTAEELTEHFNRERKICPSNSRFKRPMAPVLDKRKIIAMGGALKAGRFGIDGKEVAGVETPLATPHAGSYKFMDASPSPSLSAFGGSSTPLMTWGEIDSTPYRLDEATGRTPVVSSGSSSIATFRLPSPSKREALAHELADKAGRQRAKGRAEAMKLAKHGLLSPHISKLALSPAARRLLSTSGRLSFGSRPNSGLRSPGLGSSVTPRRLPSDLGVIRRPSTATTNQAPPTPRGGRETDVPRADSGALTNDLLNLSASKNLVSPPTKHA